MTVDEAIRLLDPKTTEQAFKEIKYYNGFNGKDAALEAFEDACVLAAEALRAQRNSGWISVKDRLPENECIAIGFQQEIIIGYIDKDAIYGGYLAENEQHMLREVTHWMPLPEPPKESPDE